MECRSSLSEVISESVEANKEKDEVRMARGVGSSKTSKLFGYSST